MAEPDIMTWFPRKEDYEVVQMILPDEHLADKINRLIEQIENSQANIKEVVDGDISLEHKIYRTMDSHQDLEDLTKLHKECEGDQDAGNHPEELKKAKIGLINLKAFLSQVDCVDFAAAIMNEFLFKVGSKESFDPWLTDAERRVSCRQDKPSTFEACMEYEQNACKFLKETVKANKQLKRLKDSADCIKANVDVQEELSKLSERYYVLCKKADGRVKNMQGLLFEWKRLDELLAPKEPKLMDDLQVKTICHFLTYLCIIFLLKCRQKSTIDYWIIE